MTGNMMRMLLMMLMTSWMIWWSATSAGAEKLIFDTKDATEATYNYFLREVREELKSSVSQGFSVLRRKSDIKSDRQRFLQLKLTNSTAGVSITLALDVVTAQLVAYQATDERSFFFKDAPSPQSEILFQNTDQTTFPFTSSYADLTQIAGANRTAIPLGMTRLSTAIQVLHDWSSGPKVTLAGALLVVIQMVPDAAKILYIQREVANEGLGSADFVPDCSAVSFEDNWGLLSSAILTADANGEFDDPVELKRGGRICKKYVVEEVNDNLRNNLALLKSNLAISPNSQAVKSVVAAEDEETISGLIMAMRKFNPGCQNTNQA